MGRGERRRRQLAEAGLELLAEGGWPAVTTRAVAERASANVGLIHYHFGSLVQLHGAVARLAEERLFDPVVDALVSACDTRDARDAFRQILQHPVDPPSTRLAIELAAGALREPVIGEVISDGLRRARERFANALEARHPDWAPSRREGVSVLLVALLDGVLLHRSLDRHLDLDSAGDTLAQLTFRNEFGEP